MFELEKKAIEYCTQYRITEDDPRRGDIINAFCVGARIEREASAERARVALDMQAAPAHWIGLAVLAVMDTDLQWRVRNHGAVGM